MVQMLCTTASWGITARVTRGLYNIASGRETSVLAVAEELCRLAGGFHAVSKGKTASRSGIQRSCGDARRLRLATGWAPRIPWQRSLAEMWRSVSRDASAERDRRAPLSRRG